MHLAVRPTLKTCQQGNSPRGLRSGFRCPPGAHSRLSGCGSLTNKMAFKRARTFKKKRFAFKKKTKMAFRAKRVTANKVNVPLGLGFPKKMTMTHKYTQTVLMTSTAGVMQQLHWSCNGMFAPFASGTGHQPLYFDQMGALYNHYTVIGSRCSFKLVPSSALQVAIVVGAYVNDDTTAQTAINTIGEQSTGTRIMIGADSNRNYTIRKKWSAKKYFGGSVLGNNDLEGTTVGNPNEQSYFNISMQAADASTTASIFVDVEISYIAVWAELKDIAGS